MNIDYIASCNEVNIFRCLTRYNVGRNYQAMKLSERLLKARKHANLTQEALAERSGVAQQVISKLEQEKQLETASIVELALACKVRPEWLAVESGDMVGGLYVVDEDIKTAVIMMQEMEPYARQAAIKEIAQVAELVSQAQAAGDKK